MRSVGGLFPTLCDETHLTRAALATARGKRRRPEVAWFLFRLEPEVRRISEALASCTWEPLGFDLLFLRDPKRRAIARAPFEDRVVHTALTMLMAPVFRRSAVQGDMACRAGFGTGRALLEAHRLLRRHRFALHLDVRAYFPSLDPTMVLGLVARRIRDRHFLAVLEQVLASGAGLLERPGVRDWLGLGQDWPPVGQGLPVGAHTSQFLATHVVLLELDHHIKRELKIPGYLRFVDDLLLYADSRAALRRAREAIGDWLWAERRLRLKHPDAPVLACAGHLDALGYRLRQDRAEPLPRAARRFRARIWRFARIKVVDQSQIRSSVASSVHHLLG